MTHAEKMVAALEGALEENPGVLEIDVDGQSMKFESMVQMKRLRDSYQKEVEREKGNRPKSAQIDLGGSW